LLSQDITVGGWTAPYEFKTAFGSSAKSAATPSSFNVTFITTGAVEVDTPVITVSYPASTFSFRLSPKVLGRHTVTLKIVGPDAALYQDFIGNGQADQLRVTVIAMRRAFAIMPASTSSAPISNGVVTDKALTRLSTGSTVLHLYVGVESRPITVSVGAIPTRVQLVPQGRGLIFNPSVVSFTGTYESLQFTITATEAYSGSTYVHFSVIGEDAGLFTIPDSVIIRTQHQFILPEFPILTVNSPVTLQVSIASNFSDPVVLTPSSINVVFIPETWLFTPQQKTVTFQAIGTSTYDVVGSNINPVIISDQSYHAAPGSQSFSLSWRFMHEPATTSNPWFFPASPIQLNVLPAGFIVSFPHLQIGQTSTLTIKTTAPPRSDVVLTLIGNNLNFNPPNILFTKSRTEASISVTPVHADYKDSEKIPFTVDYIISGSNKQDFIPPAQTFLAVSRGTAAQADSLMLSDATSHAASYVLLLVVALLALLF
jgi:hypothetical protein